MATIAPEAAAPQEPGRSFIAVNLLICSLLWGSSYLFIKLMSGDVPALAIAASRGLRGAGVLALWSLGRRRSPLPRRAEIGEFIAGVVERWDTRTLVDKLELQVGRDLQYIRINGTLVGGLVGLIIHALSRLLG